MSTTMFIARFARHALSRTTRTAIVALGVVLATAATAQAKDLCVTVPALFGTNPVVGKKFTVPGKNQCKPFHGFLQVGVFRLVTGTGCTSADGQTFYLEFTHQVLGQAILSMTCGFGRLTLEGGCTLVYAEDTSSSDEVKAVIGQSASAQPCTVNVP